VTSQLPADLLGLAAELRKMRDNLAATAALLDALEARLQQDMGAWSKTYQRDRRHQTFSLSQAARRLGISRSNTLTPAVAGGKIATVPWGPKRVRISLAEIERLEAEGFGGATARPRRTGKTRRSPPNVDEELARLRSMTLKERLDAAQRRRDAARSSKE